MKNSISISKEDYLKAALEAECEGQTVISATLAHWLGVSPPAVSMALRRLKRDGPNAAAVLRRWELESRPECSGTPAIGIDTSRSLEETVRTVIGAVWSAL